MKTIRILALFLALFSLFACSAVRAANIVLVSDNPNLVGFSGPLAGTADDTFVTLLQGAGHNVIRYTSDDNTANLMVQADIDALNTNDLIILGRSMGSGAFSGAQGAQWNTVITKPIIVQSSFLIRASRLGWFGAESSFNGLPMPLALANTTDPTNAYLFAGVALSGSVMAGNYDLAMEQNTSQTVDNPVTGGKILATGLASNKVIVEFPAGTAVKAGANILAGYRMYFASGNREAAAIPTAGSNSLTTAGQSVFLRAVTLALNNGVPPNLGNTPLLTLQPTNVAFCVGLPATLVGAASGQDPLSYQWYFNETNALSAGTNATLAFTFQDTNAGNYTLVVTNAVGVVTSDVAVVSISGTGTFASAVSSQTNCPGTPATFTTTASGSGTLTYTWKKGGAVIQGPDGNNSFSIPSVAVVDAGPYSVEVIGDCNTVSNSFNLVVVVAPVIAAQPQNQTAPMGNGAVFSVTASTFATQPTTFQWMTNGVDVTGATGSSLAISNLTLAQNGLTVSVLLGNCAGTALSATASLTVTPIHGISFDFNTPGQYTNAPYNLVGNDWMNNAIINNQPFGPVTPFEVSTGGVGVATGGGGLDLMFNRGDDQTSILLPATFDFSQTGKTLTASIMVKIKVPLLAVNVANPAIQLGFVNATNQLGAGVNAAANLIGTVNSLGFMSVMFNATVINTITPSYQLKTMNKVTNGTANLILNPLNSPTNLLATNTWYRLIAKFVNMKGAGNLASNYTAEATLQDMGLDGITPGSVVLAIPPTLQTNIDIVNHPRLHFAIRGFENAGNDYWDNISVSTASGGPAFVDQPTSQTVAQGRTASFRALVDGDGPYTYQWNRNGSPIAGAGNWKYTTPALLLADDQAQYTVTVTTGSGSVTSVPATVTVQSDDLDVLSVGSVDGSVIGLRFDQPVTKASAETAANYLINGVPAVAAQLLSNNGVQQNRTNGTEVLLTPASIISGPFTVTVAGVTSISGTALGANNSAAGQVAGLVGLDVDPLSISINGEAPRAVAGQVATLPGTTYSFAPGQFTTTAGGHDIFGTFDGFRFTYRQITGDFDLKMRVPYLDLVRTPAKAGFNARISLDPSSPNVGCYVNPMLPGRNFFEGSSRPNYWVASVSWGNNTPCIYPNAWLRFRRVGNTFLRYSSTNGVNWLFDGQVSSTPTGQPWPATIYVGLAANCNVGTGVIQQHSTSQIDGFGEFAGYAGAAIVINTQPTNSTIAAGAAAGAAVGAAVSGGGIPASAGELSYLWQRTNTALGGWTNLPTAGATNHIFSTGTLYITDSGAQYRAILSAPGALSVTSSVFTVTLTDVAGPTIVAGGALVPTNSPNQIVLNFNEFLNATALNAGNYTLTNSLGQVIGIAGVAFLNGDNRTVIITTSNPLAGGTYGVRLTGVQDLNGNNITANTLATFRQVSSGQQAGPVVADYYGSLATAANLGDLTNNVKFLANTPDWIVYSNVFGINGGAAAFPTSGMGDNYGVRLYSYFVPPTNGLYKFYFRADDFARFFINTNSLDSTNPAGKVGSLFIGANNPNYSVTNVFTNTVPMVAGQPYFMEMLFKEGTGGDGAALSIRSVGDATVPAATDVAPGAFFTFPVAVAPRPVALVELYTGLVNNTPPNGSGNIQDLRFSTNINKLIIGQPDTIAYEKYFGYSTNLGNTSLDNYMGRIISYFVPPTNGNYKFFVRSDDSSVFLMNTNAANSTDPAGMREFYFNPAYQPAAGAYILAAQNISLVAGQRYYMEGMWREGGGGDGVTVAVRAQGDASVPSAQEVILPDMLEFPAILDRVGPVSFAQAGSGPALVPVNPTITEGQTLTLFPRGLAGSPPYNFAWYRNGQQVFANQPFFVTQPLTAADNGAVYTVVVSNLFSAVSASTTVSVTTDVTAPTILSAVASQYGDSVLVTFSESVDAFSAGAMANYSIGGLQIYSVGRDEQRRNRVSLQTSPQTPNTVYTLTVNGVRDLAGVPNTIAVNSTKDFSSWGFGGVGGVYVEYFTNIQNTLVDFFQTDPKAIYNMPDFAYYTNVFSAGPFGAESGLNQYAVRVTGLFTPPSNGLYRFFVRGDDATRIYMNTNGPSPAGRVLIARNDGANSAPAGTILSGYQAGVGLGRVGASISPILSLDSGTAYFMEALMKEGGGGDHLEVLMRAIDPNTLTEIGGLPTTPAATDGFLSGGFFSAPGNPDLNQFLITSTPAAELFLSENDAVNLSLVATVLPPSLTPFVSYQWQRTNEGSGTFTNIPGAKFPTLFFFAPLIDDGATYRLIAQIPGQTISFTTLLHVTSDGLPPYMLSASSLDGNTIGIRFNEPLDANTGGEFSNYQVNSGVNEVLSATIRSVDPRTVVLTLRTPVTSDFTLDALFIGDRAAVVNYGDSSVIGTLQNFLPFDVGNPLALGSSFSDTNGSIDVVAGGADIWGTADQGHLTLRPISGNFDVSVRVDSLLRTSADTVTKAGLMIRESTSADSRTMHALVNPPVSVGGRDLGEAGTRTNAAGLTGAWLASTNFSPAGIPNAWLRFKRTGFIYTAYRSTNGVDWTIFATNAADYGRTVLVGLATTAHNNSAPPTLAQYRNLYFPNPPGITTQPAPAAQAVALHGSVSYSVVAANPANAGSLVYQWSLNGTPIPGANGATLNLADVLGANQGVYTVEVGNDGGSVISDAVNLTVNNGLPVASGNSLTATQSLASIVAGGALIADDLDPESAPLFFNGVSGQLPVTVGTNFAGGNLIGSTLFGSTYVDTTNGYLRLHNNLGSQSGSIVLDELTPGKRINGFTASFRLRLSDGTAEPADGFSFNFAPDLPLAATGPRAAEDGMGSGFSFCLDNYRFAPYPTGGSANTSGLKLRFGGVDVAGVQVPTFNRPAFVDVSITLANNGALTVLVDGTNVFGNITLPVIPTAGRFGLYARSGGQFQAAFIDDLNITVTTADTILGGSVVMSGTDVIYTAPANACGADTFYYLVNDGQVGGTSVGTVNVTVETTNAPVIVTCAPDVTLFVDGTCLVAVPDLRSQLVATSCSAVTIGQVPAPGTLVGVGVTPITLIATNSSGLIALCQPTLTVLDNILPVAVCPADIVAEATSAAGRVVTFSPTASDNCSVASLVAVPASGSTFPIGTTLVTVTATDGSGNIGLCTFNVTVRDTTAPSIDCPTNRTIVCNGTNASTTFALSATDLVDPAPTVSASVASGSNFPLGTNVVTVTAYDAAGNTNTCTFLVIVEDNALATLAITKVGADVVITWAQSCTPYVLEGTENLETPVTWLPAGGTVVEVGTNFSVTLPAADPKKFFRLLRP